jgi:hypothetical protein
MIRLLLRDTYVIVAGVAALYLFQLINIFVVGMFISRMIWMLAADWNSILENYSQSKKIIQERDND